MDSIQKAVFMIGTMMSIGKEKMLMIENYQYVFNFVTLLNMKVETLNLKK